MESYCVCSRNRPAYKFFVYISLIQEHFIGVSCGLRNTTYGLYIKTHGSEMGVLVTISGHGSKGAAWKFLKSLGSCQFSEYAWLGFQRSRCV